MLPSSSWSLIVLKKNLPGHIVGDNWHTGLPLSKESHLLWVSGACFMCMHAHTVVDVTFVTTRQYSPLCDLLLERNGQAVQAVKRCGECILSFLPLYSICCRDVTSRWMYFLSVLKVH